MGISLLFKLFTIQTIRNLKSFLENKMVRSWNLLRYDYLFGLIVKQLSYTYEQLV